MSGLRLARLRAGRSEHRSARVFKNAWLACAHMCDHLLTWPEAEEWADMLPIVAQVMGDRRAFVLAKAMWEDEGAAAQELYDEWVKVLRRSVDAGSRLGWVWEECEDAVYFSPLGIKLVTTTRAVKTAFVPISVTSSIPDDDESRDPDTLPERRRRNPLPRQGRLRPFDRTHPRDRKRSKRLDEGLLRAFRRFRRAAVRVRESVLLAAKSGMGPRGETLAQFRKAIRSFDHWALLVQEGDQFQA